VMRGALDDAREARLLGDVTVVLHRGAGAYICGEGGALVESLEGKRGQPRPRPPFPAVSGLYGSPTLINNVQTVATVPVIVEKGGEWYAKIGPEPSPGTVAFSLSGNVARPGNYELELGTGLRELIYDLGGGLQDGRAEQSELDLLLSVCDRILGKCLCALGDFAAGPVVEYVRNFREEFLRHIDEGGCPFGGESSLEGVFAPVDQHTHAPMAEVPA